MAEYAHITPIVLKWARETARISIESAASKISVSPERLAYWEEGKSMPTIRQAQELAKIYRRPFALFFLPDIPNDFQPLQDFRRRGSKSLSTASIFIIREMQQKQAWISELKEENNEPKLPFVGRFTIEDNPLRVAEDILATLDINPLEYKHHSPIMEWIDKAESIGVFISRTSFIHSRLTLDTSEIQGFAISNDYAPFIFINSKDWGAAQLFTLVHELAHIWIAQTGISNDIESVKNLKGIIHPVEAFCNEVAANALIPLEYITDFRNHINTPNIVYQYSRKLGISSYAFIIRALRLNLITIDEYSSLKAQAEAGFQEYLEKEREKKAKQKEKDGGPSPYLLRLNKNGRLFTQFVLDAYKGGFVEPNIASFLLNTPTNKFPKLEAQLYK